MKILITENQLEKLVKKYICTNYLSGLEKRDTEHGNISFYQGSVLVMRYFAHNQTLKIRFTFLHSIIVDSQQILGGSSVKGHEIRDAIKEKFKLKINNFFVGSPEYL